MRKTKVTEIVMNRPLGLDYDFESNKLYIALIDGEYFIGRMNKVWFGWNFADGWGSVGHQYDPRDNKRVSLAKVVVCR